jgi:hypothetical protein
LRELVLAREVGIRQSIAENISLGSPPAHGLQRLQRGFDLEEVVGEYNILRDCIHDLAEKNRVPILGDPFCILNNGTGISEDHLPYIFEKYETDRATPVGIGLGLSICKSFIEADGGKIMAESRLGHGASFRFTLPDQLTSSINHA